MNVKVTAIEVYRKATEFVAGGVYKSHGESYSYFILVASDGADDTDVTKYALMTTSGHPYFGWVTYANMRERLNEMYTYLPDAHLSVTKEVLVDGK